jgi:hypothetical protein
MKKPIRPLLTYAATGLLTLLLAGCPAPAAGPNGPSTSDISLSTNGGILTGSGTNWTYDMGYVPQYTIETAEPTLKNSGTSSFSATVSITGPNASDFSSSNTSQFTVNPNSSYSFTTAGFFPTAATGTQETATLTITPTNGTPIVVSLKGTSGNSFQAFDGRGVQVISSTASYTIYRGTTTFSITNAASSTSTITFPSTSPVAISGTGYSVESQPSLSPLAAGGSTSYNISDTNPTTGNLGTITIIAQDSTTNALFSITFNVVDSNAP